MGLEGKWIPTSTEKDILEDLSKYVQYFIKRNYIESSNSWKNIRQNDICAIKRVMKGGISYFTTGRC